MKNDNLIKNRIDFVNYLKLKNIFFEMNFLDDTSIQITISKSGMNFDFKFKDELNDQLVFVDVSPEAKINSVNGCATQFEVSKYPIRIFASSIEIVDAKLFLHNEFGNVVSVMKWY
ncbi:MAG: hypothetical protein M0R51_16475 [Clostridia bacterium]|jgi:hypothetical protein|nr:hypothetical protein [Clostridia bacterium]